MRMRSAASAMGYPGGKRVRSYTLRPQAGAAGKASAPGLALVGGTSVPMLSAQVAAIREKSIAAEIPPTKAAPRTAKTNGAAEAAPFMHRSREPLSPAGGRRRRALLPARPGSCPWPCG
ncbi:DUF6053 domain-containing protein [Lysobacter enzymogenes]|uniref:DUF6053 domain-containing protein n=1 Tax=Lysobacter enzymogenes TaxID=69 RepID=UPI0037478F3D